MDKGIGPSFLFKVKARWGLQHRIFGDPMLYDWFKQDQEELVPRGSIYYICTCVGSCIYYVLHVHVCLSACVYKEGSKLINLPRSMIYCCSLDRQWCLRRLHVGGIN